MKKARFGIGLVIGAIAGVVAGLLTAPKSGKETRADLKRKKDEVQDKATAKAEEVKGKAADKFEEAKGKARDVADDAKTRADELKTRATRAAESAKAAWNDEDGRKKSKASISWPKTASKSSKTIRHRVARAASWKTYSMITMPSDTKSTR